MLVVVVLPSMTSLFMEYVPRVTLVATDLNCEESSFATLQYTSPNWPWTVDEDVVSTLILSNIPEYSRTSKEFGSDRISFNASEVRGKQPISGQSSDSTSKHPERQEAMMTKDTVRSTLTLTRRSLMLMKACNTGHNIAENAGASLLYGTA